MPKRIIITGATGLIGKNISNVLLDKKYELIILSRSPQKAELIIPGASQYLEWDSTKETSDTWKRFIDGADAIIHLAGENVMAKRWSEDHKRNVIESRRIGTKKLVDAIAESSVKPKLFLSASAIGYYGYNPFETFDENSKYGSDFFSDVVKVWEDEAIKAKQYGAREVRIRIGIVLDKNEGALAKMIIPYKYCIGGPLGSGKQWFPWIHIDDLVNLFVYAIENDFVHGALNGVSPGIVTMKEFSKMLGKAMHRPSIFKVPEFILKIIVGEGADAVTKVSKVVPTRTIESGYHFSYAELEKTLHNILK
ncbi:MAG: TIGR01777 family oxidoreductase [bacterium]